jgi:hypothetical protein
MTSSTRRRAALAALPVALALAACSSGETGDSAADASAPSSGATTTATTSAPPTSASAITNKLESGNTQITTSVRPEQKSYEQAPLKATWTDVSGYNYGAAGYTEANQVITHDYLKSAPGKLNIRTDYKVGIYLSNITPQRQAPFPPISALPAWPTDSVVCRELTRRSVTEPVGNGEYCAYTGRSTTTTTGGKKPDTSDKIGPNATVPVQVVHGVEVTVDDEPAVIDQVTAELAEPVFLLARNGNPNDTADTAYQHGCYKERDKTRITEASIPGFVCKP